MKNHNVSLILILFIAGISQLSETLYTPSLPSITKNLITSPNLVAYTLTSFLVGFAIGTLFWGTVSDKFGRKPCIVLGIIVFMISSIFCGLSNNISSLIAFRLIQGFGASIGSVLGQAIARDSFSGADLTRVYVTIGTSLSFFPAVGPFIGGLINERIGWRGSFFTLAIFAALLIFAIIKKLPETMIVKAQKVNFFEVIFKIVKDKNVIVFGLIVGICNGISFSYFSEGSFFLIEMLKLSPSKYGASFAAIASGSIIGGFISKRMIKQGFNQKQIISLGIALVVIINFAFLIASVLYVYISYKPIYLIFITIIAQSVSSIGICMATTVSLSIALMDYKWCTGTASSLFGFFYYLIASGSTMLIGFLHNGTAIIMPLCFFGLALMMVIGITKTKEW